MSRGQEGLTEQASEIMDLDGISGVERVKRLLVDVADCAMLNGLARNRIGCDHLKAPEPLGVADSDVLQFVSDYSGRGCSVGIEVNRPTDHGTDGEAEKNEGAASGTAGAPRFCPATLHFSVVVLELTNTSGSGGFSAKDLMVWSIRLGRGCVRF